MLKTTKLSKKLCLKAFKADDKKMVNNSGNKTNKTIINLSRNLTHMPNIGAIGESTFIIPNTKKIFNYLWLAFIKAIILQHFDLKSYI